MDNEIFDRKSEDVTLLCAKQCFGRYTGAILGYFASPDESDVSNLTISALISCSGILEAGCGGGRDLQF